jgi:hypothetical protein
MNPEEQHHRYLKKYAGNRMKNGVAMARCRFSAHVGAAEMLDFKVYVQIWQDEDWLYAEWHDFCKKLVEEKVTLNNSSYKAIADELFLLIAEELPSRNVWIKINQNDVGITIRYDT